MKYLSVVLITLVTIVCVSLVGGFYYYIFTYVNLPFILKFIVLLGYGGLILAMITVGVSRLKEIKKEKNNDLSKY